MHEHIIYILFYTIIIINVYTFINHLNKYEQK